MQIYLSRGRETVNLFGVALVCGRSHGACMPIDSMLLGVQVTTGLGFFLCSSRLSVSDE